MTAEICKIAFQNGYRCNDSARFYENEGQTGVGIQRSCVKREDIFYHVTSKVSHGGYHTRAAVKDSIPNLGYLAYDDLYLTYNAIGGNKARPTYPPPLCGALDNPVIQELATRYSKDATQILIGRQSVPLPKSSQPQCVISNSLVLNWNIESMDIAKLDALNRGKEGAVTWNPVDVDQGAVKFQRSLLTQISNCKYE
ncbi:hypothetical protein K503DRAFT_794330 [Rhizopogon vinicolor AM-OR11-026]|uniref:NADP-dependent oxidoreductase domain-containing protein n=1 Tax=Rhizopogon vinicolor AM-OR11-026 TaxID=1314800 RepID=A0A1B7MMZ9_9AGAM|nr:hypothetical protein K503DRAFT_794330 [Rhizopogon vinicolor AM-OR11-026]